MNLGYLSVINLAGIPKNITKFSKNSFATEEALRAPYPTKKDKSLQYLVNLSTQIKIVLLPLKIGRSMVKSILKDTILPFETGNGYKKPG